MKVSAPKTKEEFAAYAAAMDAANEQMLRKTPAAKRAAAKKAAGKKPAAAKTKKK